MAEITIDTDSVVAAVVAKLELSPLAIDMAVHDAVDRQVRQAVKAEVETSIKTAVRAAVAEAMPEMAEAIRTHVAEQMKVRQRRFEAKLARVAED